MSKTYDAIVIGAGQAGPPLAGRLSIYRNALTAFLGSTGTP